MTTLTFLVLCTLLSAASTASAQRLVCYKPLEKDSLFLEILYPEGAAEASPAIVFFFGGGWKVGSRDHFRGQAQAVAEAGMVAVLADYRTSSSHGTTPFESLKDARSAMRYLRAHAADLGIDPDQIVAAGGSAGGHLAAGTAYLDDYNDPNDDLTISPKPAAMVLFNPVVDNGPSGYGFDRIYGRHESFSPLHNITAPCPPTLVLLGDQDKYLPVATAEQYCQVSNDLGGDCRVVVYPGQKHAFFNLKISEEHYYATLNEMLAFLRSLGYLPAE